MKYTKAGKVPLAPVKDHRETRRVLRVELLAIDLVTCARCAPTSRQLEKAIDIVRPAAEILGIAVEYSAMTISSAEEARETSLLSSPTIRLNGRDIARELRESACETCGDLIGSAGVVECRDWIYRGESYCVAPVPMLVEELLRAILNLDELPYVKPTRIEKLPDNLERFFSIKSSRTPESGCC